MVKDYKSLKVENQNQYKDDLTKMSDLKKNVQLAQNAEKQTDLDMANKISNCQN